MTRQGFWNEYYEVEQREQAALHAALEELGGSFDFESCEECDCPTVVGSFKHVDDTEEYVVTRVEAGSGTGVTAWGYPKYLYTAEIDEIYYINFGGLSEILLALPSPQENGTKNKTV